MGSSWKKEGGDREEEEKTDVQAARDNPRKRARPILNLQEQLILGLSTVPGGTTCPSIYVPYSRQSAAPGLAAAWEALRRLK